MPDLESQSRAVNAGRSAASGRTMGATARSPHQLQGGITSGVNEKTMSLDVLQAQLNAGAPVLALQQSAARLRARPAQALPGVVQRVPISRLIGGVGEPAALYTQLAALIVHQPGNDQAEQEEFWDALAQANDIWQSLGDTEIGDKPADQRINLAAVLMQRDAPAGLQRLISYHFGLRERPHDAPRAIGSLELLRNEHNHITGIAGRPGLFAIPTGGASQARRHIIAWHTLRNLMNRLIMRFGAGGVAEISRLLARFSDENVANQSAAIAQGQARMNGPDFHILHLAIMLNNVPHNLWLGAARENISINTMVYHLTRWTNELRRRALPLSDYIENVRNYNSGSPMARNAVTNILTIVDQARVEHPNDAHLVVYDQFVRFILPSLEIDPRRAEQISPLQLFLYEAGEGTVVIRDAEQIMTALREFMTVPEVPPIGKMPDMDTGPN